MCSRTELLNYPAQLASKPLRRLAFFCLTIPIFFLPLQAQSQEAATKLEGLNIPALIRESDHNGAQMHQRLTDYCYIQKRVSREQESRGKITETIKLFEAYPIKVEGRHQHVISLFSKDGVPLLKEEREELLKRAVERMQKAEQPEVRPARAAVTASAEKYLTVGVGISEAGEGVWVGVSQFLRQCQFNSPRRTQLGNREMIAMSFGSCADNPAAPRERYIAQMVGLVWIDATDKVIARLEAWPKPRNGTTQNIFLERPATELISYEQMRVTGGIWVPSRIRLKGLGNATLLNGVDKDMTFEFLNYEHFSTDAEAPSINKQKLEQ